MYEPTKIPGAFMIQHIFSGSIHHDMLDHKRSRNFLLGHTTRFPGAVIIQHTIQ